MKGKHPHLTHLPVSRFFYGSDKHFSYRDEDEKEVNFEWEEILWAQRC
jgi:hypothetical protein